MLMILSYIAVLVFIIGVIYRGLKIKSMPMHLRWELAPVPHEKGKAHYGGSYLEEFEWWTKKREKSLINEAVYMFKEIVFLKGVWEHNRSLWIFSFPFHFGLYMLAGMAGFMVLGHLSLLALGVPAAIMIFGIAHSMGALGYVMGTMGTLGLLAKRMFDPKLKPFTSLSSYFNLIVLGAMFASGLTALIFNFSFLDELAMFAKAFFTANASVAISASTSAHIFFAMLFLIYLPFTYMMHFVAKYFMYHEIRWNDEPMGDNPAMQEEVKILLSQTVTWSAPHLGANKGQKKNWVDIATSEMPKKEDKNA
ncbi:respiratory nitrate reductase subunit gamma [Elusimicrobiota bacterium]